MSCCVGVVLLSTALSHFHFPFSSGTMRLIIVLPLQSLRKLAFLPSKYFEPSVLCIVVNCPFRYTVLGAHSCIQYSLSIITPAAKNAQSTW